MGKMVCGGCLGTCRRRRTWLAAKSHGEPLAGFEPWMSEWGNPMEVMLHHPVVKLAFGSY